MNDSLSLNKTQWVMPDVDLNAVEQVARAHDLPEIVARILVQRGVRDIPAFLEPTLKEHLPNPLGLKDMEALAAYMVVAIVARKNIAIFGDFDVDGATSSALMHRFLKHCTIDAPIYIPARLTEGYGPNVDALQSLKDGGAEIVFLLDCGTTAFDVVQAGVDMGLDIIILDHHEAEEKLAAAKFTINPKRKDDVSNLDMLAAVGVTFLTCVAINVALREAGFFEQQGISQAPLILWLDIVALGTVCDMVPLTHVNRLLVRQGFKQMQNSVNPGLNALIETSRITDEITPYHAGFILGPRINAGSRVHQSDLGARLLSTDDAQEANDIAWTLNDCNDKRKAIQQDMEREALEMVEREGMTDQPLIFVASEHFHQGLSGLVAGRLKDKYKKPACVVALLKNEHEGRGSGRSVAGIHIAQSFIDARNEGIIVKGGGHAMAGGFTVAVDKIDVFREFLYKHVAAQMKDGVVNVQTVVDGNLTVRGASADLVRMLQNHIGPFGQEHAEPLFLFQNVRLYNTNVVGEAHIRTMISDWEGGTRMKAMAFRGVGTPLGDAILKQSLSHSGCAFNLLGTLKLDNWGGRDNVELHIKDASLMMQEHIEPHAQQQS